MYKRFEASGSGLLARFVPRVDAAAPGVFHHNPYWQCAGSQCCLNTSTGDQGRG
jgi:hypothetical protein